MSGSYFQTSFSTLEALAKKGRFEYVAGFLILARHATSTPITGFPPYTFSGAGVNGIHEKGGMSEENARGVLEELKKEGIISAPPSSAKQESRHVRWKVNQGKLDLCLPHALVDGLTSGKVTSALKRIKNPSSPPHHTVDGLSNTERSLDALMLLLHLYKNVSMETFGGVSPKCIYREWTVHSRTQNAKGVRWGAEPELDKAFYSFMSASLSHRNGDQVELSETEKRRFWNAWRILCNERLVYEAVSLFDANPTENDKASLICTLRLNDFHANTTGDPNLLATMEAHSDSLLGFYTNKDNDRDEPEAMWLILPFQEGNITGIWRPRFRAATSDAGVWKEKEEHHISNLLNQLPIAQGT